MRQPEGWDGISLKRHVESAQSAADYAEETATELGDKVEELDDRISELEASQTQSETDARPIRERRQAIDFELKCMAKNVESLAAHIALTCETGKLQAQGCDSDFLFYIQHLRAEVETKLLVLAEDIRALTNLEKNAVHHERG